MEIHSLKTFSVKLTQEDIWELLLPKLQKEYPDAKIEPGDFSIHEKVVNSYALNNFESEDVMGFSHITYTGILKKEERKEEPPI